SRGHRRVGKALLVSLGDASIVWFEPPFEPAEDRRLPDFVVLDPSLGIVVVTVFEQSEGQEVLGALRGGLRIVEAGAEVSAPNPLQVADSFVAGLMDRLAQEPELAMIPVGGVAAFPYLSRAEAEALGFGGVVALERCLFSDEIDAFVRDDQSVSLTRILSRLLEGGVEDLMEEDVQARIRAMIHPEVVIGAAPEQGSLFVATPADGEDTVRVMDLHQERFAKRINPGHRVVRGVAGSGKTLILVTRARLMSRVNPAGQILVTCFTRSLASVLRAQLASLPNVKVATLDQLASELIQSAGLSHPGWKGNSTPYSVALEAIELRPPQRYRAVLVDEAQDFDDDGLKLCVALAEPGADGMGDLLIVADSAQRIYDRTFTWSASGIQARGRTSVLRVNYRNTKEVLTFAKAFVDAYVTSEPVLAVAARDDLDVDGETVVIPAEATERHGPAPTVHFVDDLSAEIDTVLETVHGWYSDGLPARSIAVLMQSGADARRAELLMSGLADRGLPAFWATESRDAKDRIGMTEDAIVVSTIHSAKGLEFPRVVTCGLTNRSSGDWVARNRNTLYVGFTRAIDELAVVASSSSPYASALKDAAAATQVPSD
ncbi:MAG: 3'-5' exonuclease, partial [Microthrixaceae bacterium]